MRPINIFGDIPVFYSISYFMDIPSSVNPIKKPFCLYVMVDDMVCCKDLDIDSISSAAHKRATRILFLVINSFLFKCITYW